jgi:repressor LexA
MADDKHLAAMRTYWKRHAAFPAMAKLCELLGLSSTASVFAAVGRFSEAGDLKPIERHIAPRRRLSAQRVLGQVRDGLPQPVSREPPEVLTLDAYLIDHPSRMPLHRVRGDSMRDADISDGDLVFFKHNAPNKAGDIVAAYVDNELTVRTLRLDRKGSYFQPANPAYEPIHPRLPLEVLGIVFSVGRRIRR